MHHTIQYGDDVRSNLGAQLKIMAKVNRQNSTRKKAMIEALEKALGVVTTACKIVGIDRQTHYNWLEQDEAYARQVADIKDIALDFAESQLHKRMKNGSDTAIIFYLKTQGKNRGYIEKQQIEHSGEVKLPKWLGGDGES